MIPVLRVDAKAGRKPGLAAQQNRPINNRPQVTNQVTNLPHEIIAAREEGNG